MDSQNGRHLQVECVVAHMLAMRAHVVLMNVPRGHLMSDGAKLIATFDTAEQYGTMPLRLSDTVVQCTHGLTTF
jgi:hypothetical protein